MISRGGLLIGSILFARVADQIGRKPVFLFCLWTSGLLSLSKAFAPNFFAYGVIDFTRAIMSQVSYMLITHTSYWNIIFFEILTNTDRNDQKDLSFKETGDFDHTDVSQEMIDICICKAFVDILL